MTNEKIVLKTLFKSVEVEFKDIKNYECKRYKKSEFYKFLVCCKEKKILINTRYKDDLEKLLKKQSLDKLALKEKPKNEEFLRQCHPEVKFVNYIDDE